MKRLILCLTLVIVAISALASCSTEKHTHTAGEWKVTKVATCTEEGERVSECTECDEILATAKIAASHDFEITTIDPTCTERGYDSYVCTRCDVTSMSNFVDATGHSCAKYDVINYDATATKDGTAYGTCDNCSEYTLMTLTGSADSIARAFYGKKVSIIGDSISTYVNVSNGTAANTTNSNISKNSLYYSKVHNEALNVSLDDTWWMQVINALGADLLVNNSDSGGYIRDPKSNGNPGAYLNNAVNLHDNTGDDAGTEPDIVFVYLGTNDFGKYYNNYGDVSKIDFDNLEAKCTPDYYPTSIAEAYAILLYKITREYEGAEIYCLNILDSTLWSEAKRAYLPQFNAMIADVAAHFNATVVDIYNESGIKNDENFEKYIPADDGDDTKNTLHPNALGFKLIADVVLKEVRENSKYFPEIYDTAE